MANPKEDVYIVDQVLDYMWEQRTTEENHRYIEQTYLVSWVGYDASHNSRVNQMDMEAWSIKEYWCRVNDFYHDYEEKIAMGEEVELTDLTRGYIAAWVRADELRVVKETNSKFRFVTLPNDQGGGSQWAKQMIENVDAELKKSKLGNDILKELDRQEKEREEERKEEERKKALKAKAKASAKRPGKVRVSDHMEEV